jgi:gliding motility-associated-like protein
LNRFFSLLVATSLLAAISAFAQPTFNKGADITVDQNSGVYGPQPWATSIVATNPVFDVQIIGFSGSITSFVSPPTIDAGGNLAFEIPTNVSGIVTLKAVLNDGPQSSIPATFKINVTFINSPPTFTVPAGNQTIDEKDGPQTVLGWATNISADANPIEVNQSITFTASLVSQTPFMSFVQPPKIDPSGTLTYEVASTANGSATIDVVLKDDGSNTPPNSNTSATETFTITVNPINDPPTFTMGDNIVIDEHTGMVSIPNWATNISAGPPDEEASQTVNFVLTENSITTFLQFDIPPTVDANGTLTFQATNHYNGSAVYEIYLLDDGPSVSPHDNQSASKGFSITVDFINDAPSFSKGPDIVVAEGNTIYTFPLWATNISPGESPNEQDQELRFSVVFRQVIGTLAFLRLPEIDVNGQLVFQATEHTHGEAIFDVFLIDDGEFEAPHENESPVQSFVLTVTPVNFPPNDIFLSGNSLLEKQPSGTFVGELSTADLDPEDSHNYALVPGAGSDDNDSFVLSGEDLLTNEEFDWATKNTYTIRIKTSDGEFSLEKSFIITVEKLIEGIKFANAITPNGDGENDTWEIEDIEAFPDVTIFIYDNAGQNVFKAKQGYTPWDGTFNGRQLPMGTYYYIIDLNDGSDVYKGTITILL